MQNIDVRFSATSNFGEVRSQLAALQGQAAALAKVLQSNAYAASPAALDPIKWRASTRAVEEASRIYRDAASSSGLLQMQQIRATSETDKMTRALQRQKIGLGEMLKNRGLLNQVYKDQLRGQKMTVQNWGTDGAGKTVMDVSIPKNVPGELDNLKNRLGFISVAAKSASADIINMGKNVQWSGRQLTVGFSYPLAMFGAAAGVMSYKVDEVMTKVTKVYDVSAAAQKDELVRVKELEGVREKSWALGAEAAKKYGMSITDTLGIEERLAATGLTGNKLFESSKEAARVATLGDLDFNATTDMTVSLQTAFRDTIKTTDDLADTFNYMNAVENATSLSLADIAEATPRAASAMSALGVSAKEMTVLLVSMRESGVDAAEGANALKSATGTILAPSPAADKFIQQLTDGKVQVKELAKASGGNLYKALQVLSGQMQGLSDLEKQQVLVKLFGKYQFNRVSAMLYNLEDAFAGTANQTNKAMGLMGADMEALSKSAEQELGEKMESASGRFKAAWEGLRVELAETGAPFLDVATQFASFVGKMLGYFNELNDGIKKFAMGGAFAVALAGPLVMLVGLFLQLSGWTGRAAAGLVGLFGNMRILTTEQRASAVALQAQEAAARKNTQTLDTQRAELAALAQAYSLATQHAKAYTASVAGNTSVVTGDTPTFHRPASGTIGPVNTPGLKPLNEGSSAKQVKAYDKVANAERKNMHELAMQREAYDRQTGQAYQKRVEQVKRIGAEQNKQTAAYNNSAAAAGTIGPALMSGAAALTMLNTENDSFINKLSKWLLIGTLVVPAIRMAAAWTARLAASANAAAAGMFRTAAGARATALASAKGVGSGLLSSIGGKGGAAGLAIAATVGAAVWAHNKSKEIQAERLRLAKEEGKVQNQLTAGTDRWLNTLEKAPAAWGRVYSATTKVADQQKRTRVEELTTYYKTPQDGAKRSDADALQAKSVSPKERDAILLQKYIELQVRGGLTADQAKEHIEAMFLAMDKGASESKVSADQIARNWGGIDKNFDWSKALVTQMDVLNKSSEYEMDAVGKRAAQAFSTGLANAAANKDIVGAKSLMAKFVDPLANEIGGVYDKIKEQAASSSTRGNGKRGAPNPLSKFLIDNAIESEKDLAAYIQKNGLGDINKALSSGGRGPANPQTTALKEDLAKAKNMQDALLAGMDAIYKFDKGQVGSIFDIPEVGEIAAVTSTYEQQRVIIKDMEKSWHKNALGIETAGSHLSENEKQLRLNAVNAINVANGFKQGKTEAEAIGYFLMAAKDEAAAAADKANKLKGALGGLPSRISIEIDTEQGVEIAKTAMGAVQDRMVTSANNKFESQWTSRMDAVKNGQQSASDAMEKRNEAETKAFEDRWERRKKAVEDEFDARKKKIDDQIEAEQKAEEIRKRLFDAERRRLKQWQDEQNRNIDMSQAIAEGRMDDAARIGVDSQVAGAEANMDNEEANASNKSEDKVGRLETKSESLDKQREKALEKLEKTEERMRAHMDNAQKAREAGLQRQQQATIASMEKQKEVEKASLDQRLALFKSYTGKNQKDLEAWMKTVGLTYDDFGSDVMAKGDSWSRHFKRALRDEILLAGSQVASNNMWEQIGADMVGKLVKGMGFKNWNDFKKFVTTGKLTQTDPTQNGGKKAGANAPKGTAPQSTMHGGGEVGKGSTGRGNIPNTYKGLHRSEEIVRAQKGEYIINARAMQDPNARSIAEAINRGDAMHGGLGGPGVGNVAAAAMGSMVATGIGHAMGRGITRGNKRAKARDAAASGPGGGTVGGGGYKKPNGKWNSPWNGHYTTGNGHDYGLVYKPIYAPRDGTLTTHATRTGSRGPKNGGFGSYGQHVKFNGGGASMMFAHLSKLPFSAGGSKQVRAGQYIGTTGETGNAWGPHVHVELPANSGNTHNFGNFFRSAGVSLRKGGTIKYDDTPAMLHRGETVLTDSLTRNFKENVASGGGDEYTISVDMRGSVIREEIDIERAINAAIDKRESKRGRARVVR